METFQKLVYKRPDLETEKKRLAVYEEKLENAGSYEELKAALLEQEQYSAHWQTMYGLAYIRNSMDTADAFYDQELEAMNRQQKELAVQRKAAEAALLASPYLEQVKEEFGEQMVKKLESGQRLASPETVEDMVEEARLCQEYYRVVSSCHREFYGEDCNFSGLLKHMQDTDRGRRREAFQAWADMYGEISGTLDRIYDDMVEVRKRQAEKLGFDSYISLAYARMERFSYTPEDVKRFRGYVKTYLVPLCERLFQEQKERLGVEKLCWYDEALYRPEGNPAPRGDQEQMLLAAGEMYRELSPETGEFFDFMTKHELFDLEGRVGKQPGGYCDFLPEVKAPFIYANFNGTSADVDVLTHEAGHAFEAYTAGRIYPLSSMVWSTSEIDEIHSMSMEFFTYPWMEKFFGDQAEAYRQIHLAENLEAVPYMVAVDEFQHRVFEENLDGEGRRRAWKELEQTYLPWRSYDGNRFLETGGFWMQKLHIFVNPFYYIDYALAQTGAFAFYRKMEEDREKAWADYVKLCRLGGSRGYFETLSLAGLSSPFAEETVKDVAGFLEQKLL